MPINLIDLIFPKTCVGCGEWGSYLCPQCLNKIKEKKDRICPVCCRPALGGAVHPGCKSKYSLDGITSLFSYSGIVAAIIKKIKFRFLYDTAGDLVEVVSSILGEDEAFCRICRQKPIIIPVPLHPSRKRWRGFNQAELLGKLIAGQLRLSFIPYLLVRTRKTQTQSLLNKTKRQENIKDAFALNLNYLKVLKNHKIIIFDDIWTTGSTMRECANTLKRNGASFVWGLTLAS